VGLKALRMNRLLILFTQSDIKSSGVAVAVPTKILTFLDFCVQYFIWFGWLNVQIVAVFCFRADPLRQGFVLQGEKVVPIK